jgi:hypothetical protein
MTKEDGTEVIAKIPCTIAGPPMYTTASEVAVMKYGRDLYPTLATRSVPN